MHHCWDTPAYLCVQTWSCWYPSPETEPRAKLHLLPSLLSSQIGRTNLSPKYLILALSNYIDHYLIHTHTPKPYTNPNFIPTMQGNTFKPHLLRALYMLKRRGQRPVPTSNCDWYMVDLAFEMTESLDNIPQTQLWLRWFLFLCLSHSAHMLHKPMRHCTLTANPSHYPLAHCSPCHKTVVNLMD